MKTIFGIVISFVIYFLLLLSLSEHYSSTKLSLTWWLTWPGVIILVLIVVDAINNWVFKILNKD